MSDEQITPKQLAAAGLLAPLPEDDAAGAIAATAQAIHEALNHRGHARFEDCDCQRAAEAAYDILGWRPW